MMDNRRFDRKPDPEWERLMEEGLSGPPSEEILRQITPWRKAIKRILIGLVLETITLNFGMLDYILPAFGHVLLLLGLRMLRRENRAFHVWWYALLLQTGLWAFQLIRRAAPGWQTALGQELIWLVVCLQLVQYLCLWLSLRTVRRDAGLPPGNCGGKLLILYCVLLCLPIVGWTQVGWLFFLAFLVVYVCIIRGVYKLSKALDAVGYSLHPAPIRIPDWPLAGGILGALLLGIVVVGLTCNHLPMDWQPVDSSEDSQVEELISQLQDLGFPEEVLADLSDEDILSCDGAVRVVSDARSIPVTYQTVTNETPRPLTITGVAVELEEELEGEQKRWRVFHHFAWETGVRFSNTEAIQLWPTYHSSQSKIWFQSSDVTGRVLYDQDGTTLWSPYYSLGIKTFTSNSMFYGAQTSADLFASFSFPTHGEHCRGYVTYETTATEDGYLFDSWIFYAHARMWFQYPVLTAEEWLQTRGMFDTVEPFFYIQKGLQF